MVRPNAGHIARPFTNARVGSIVRIGPNQLSFDDPKLIPLVYNREAEKTPFYSTGLAGEVAPLLQIQGHREHAAKLKTLSATVGLIVYYLML